MKQDTNKTMPSTANQFQAVWNQVISDPYIKLPQNSVSFGKLSTWSRNLILENAMRTIENRADILEPTRKTYKYL